MMLGVGASGITAAVAAPVHALPIDIFRVLAGLVGLLYFARIFYDAPDLSHHDGLIDHRLCRRVFPPTRMTLFHPRMPGFLFRPLYFVACVCSCLVIVGYHPKVAAGFLFLTAVCTYRWNLFAVYVDDAIAHLTFLWLTLLPVGTTLDLSGLARGGRGTWDSWAAATVPGTSVRAFMANMALVYVVAGVYKFTSPMWREGSALHAILKMPIARWPDFWTGRHLRLLRLGNYWALVIEPLLALMFVLPANSAFKWLIALSAVAFHVGIIATLKIPFANLAMLGALPVALGPEIMQLGFGQPSPPSGGVAAPLSFSDLAAWALVAGLTSMIVLEVLRSWALNDLPLWKTHMSGFLGNPLYVLLWIFGIAQSYRLFDWIDSRNYHVRYEVFEAANGDDRGRARIDQKELFPGSLRHLLLQSYLVGNVWLQIDTTNLKAVRNSLLERHAQRYAKARPGQRTVEVFTTVQRVTSDNLELGKGERSLLMRFRCDEGRAVLEFPPRGA